MSADYRDRALFSPCRNYRYTLWRAWGADPRRFLQVIGLNPSTADETSDDPTVRRCIGYAKAWGFDALCMTNLFALRATDPRVMMAHESPIDDPDSAANSYWLRRVSLFAKGVLCAWGNHGEHMGRGRDVYEMLRAMGPGQSLMCLDQNKSGHPQHPLYLKGSLKPVPLEPWW